MVATIADYVEACDYPGRLDAAAVDAALRRYLAALGDGRPVVRLPRGWTIDTHPAIRTHVMALAADVGGLDARVASAASDALDARGAIVARDALYRFAPWAMAATGWWHRWDLCWVSITALGARETRSAAVSAWSDPLLDAFVSGCWRLIWTEDALLWVAKPRVHLDSARRLHCETGHALVADDADAWFWRGTLIPNDWLPNRATLDPSIALTWRSIEQRRCAADIIGWHRVLAKLDAKTIDRHDDPQVGELVEVDLPEAGRERFLRVLCGTSREFALPVPPNMRTAMEAQAWTYGFDNPKKFKLPEVRS